MPRATEDDLAELLLASLAPALAFDRAPDGVTLDRHGVTVTLAFDREIPKHKPGKKQEKESDSFERLHVKRVPITKACVNPYYGHEIPKARELGLDPNKVYWLLRDPSEIRKAAPSFHNIPLLSKHVPHTADDHDGDITVGTVGSEAVYEHPYLYNSLAIWSREGLHYAEGDQKELSSAYGYDADMTPGVYEGQRYDGVMRNMRGNHVCMVKKGRAGSDVALDEALDPTNQETTMSKKPTAISSSRAMLALGALRGHFLASKIKLAQDASIPDFSPLFVPVKVGKFKSAIPTIVKGVEKGLKPVLAQDADLAGIVKGVEQLMSSVEGDKTTADAEVDVEPSDMEDPGTGEMDPDEPVMDGSCEAIAAYLKEKGVPDDIINGMPGMGEGAEGQDNGGPTNVMKKRLAGDKDEIEQENGPDGKGKKKMITEGAMDAALKRVRAETIKTMNDVSDARKAVKPVVGEIEMALDSAEGVYQQAFKMLGNDDAAKIKDLAALKAAWGLVPVPGAARQQLAQDEDTTGRKSFTDRFPNASKVRKAG